MYVHGLYSYKHGIKKEIPYFVEFYRSVFMRIHMYVCTEQTKDLRHIHTWYSISIFSNCQRFFFVRSLNNADVDDGGGGGDGDSFAFAVAVAIASDVDDSHYQLDKSLNLFLCVSFEFCTSFSACLSIERTFLRN